MRFSDIVNRTVRFGAVIYPTVRVGCGFENLKTLRCGSVRCFQNATVRFGAVNRIVKNPAFLCSSIFIEC